jgi:hypothetical protein
MSQSWEEVSPSGAAQKGAEVVASLVNCVWDSILNGLSEHRMGPEYRTGLVHCYKTSQGGPLIGRPSSVAFEGTGQELEQSQERQERPYIFHGPWRRPAIATCAKPYCNMGS